jgi:hypothetical protein
MEKERFNLVELELENKSLKQDTPQSQAVGKATDVVKRRTNAGSEKLTGDVRAKRQTPSFK